MIMAIGVLGLLTVVGSTAAYYTTANTRASSHSSVKQKGFSLAEAGLGEAFGVLFEKTNNPYNPYLLAERTSTYENGTVKWSGVLSQGSNPKWTITSRGTYSNPSVAAGSVTRTTTAVVKVDPSYTQQLGPNAQAWNFIYSTATGDPDGCDALFENTTEMSSPMYIVGNLCVQNASWISGGPLLVHGQVTLAGNDNSVGISGAPINKAHIAVGCKWKNNPLRSPCSSADNVFATEITNTPATYPWPTAEADKWYLNGSPGPYYTCLSSSGTPPVFDNDAAAFTDSDAVKLTKKNRSVPGSFNLTPSTNYNCTTLAGQIDWDASSKKLTVWGTLYIDGDIKIDTAGALASYDGHGTIYASGSLLIKGSWLCASVKSGICDWADWDPNDELLALVALGNGGQSGVASDQSAVIDGSHTQLGIYAPSKLSAESGSGSPEHQGPIVTGKLVIGNGLRTYPFPGLAAGANAGLPGQPVVYGLPRPPESFSG